MRFFLSTQGVFLLLISGIILSGCTPKNGGSKNPYSLEHMDVSGSGEFGSMDWNQSLSSVISLKNTSSSPVSINPSVEGLNADSFILVSSRGCSTVAPQGVCSIKLMVSARGLVAGDHFANLNLGSLGSLPLTATINATPEPIIEVQVDGNVTSSVTFDVAGKNKVTKIVALRNIGPVTMSSMDLTKDLGDVSVLVNTCGSLPPSKMCFIKLSVSGKNVASTQSGSLNIGSLLSVTMLVNSSVIAENPSLTVTKSEVDAGDFTTTGQKYLEILTFTNTGNVSGNLDLQGLPAGYSVVASSCGNVMPKAKCYVKIQYTNQQSSVGGYSDSLSLGASNVVFNHNMVSANPLSRISLSVKDDIHHQECESIQISLEDAQNQPVIKSSDVDFSVSNVGSLFEDSNCQNALTNLKIVKFTSQKTIYLKNSSLGSHNLVVSVGSIQASKTIFAYEDLSLSPVSSSLITSSPQQFSVSGGKSPFSYSVMSGIGDISSSGLYSSSAAGSATIRVVDAVGQIKTANVSVANPVSLVAGAVNQVVSSQQNVSASGGFPPYSYSIVSGGGSINSSTGSFTSPASASLVTIRVTDSLNNQAETLVNVVSLVSITPLTPSVLVSTTQSFSGSGGLSPYSYSIVSGGGSINSATGLFLAGNVAGSSVVRVTDALNQTAETTISALSNLSLNAGSCTGSTLAGNTCQIGTTGGLGTITYSVDAPSTISSTGVLTPQCSGTNNSTTVRAADAYGNEQSLSYSFTCVYSSCSQLKTIAPATPSGVYWIDTDTIGSGLAPFQVYCDQTQESGGWALVAKYGNTSNNVYHFFVSSYGSLTLDNSFSAMAVSPYANRLSSRATEIKVNYGNSFSNFYTIKDLTAQKNNLWSGTGSNDHLGYLGVKPAGFSTNMRTGAVVRTHVGTYNGTTGSGFTSNVSANQTLTTISNAGGYGSFRLPGIGTTPGTNLWELQQPFLQVYVRERPVAANPYPTSCLDAKNKGTLNQLGGLGSGVFIIDPDGAGYGLNPFSVVCDQETAGGGWTVIQQRKSQTDFYQNWETYKAGFGTISLTGSYWLGLDRINALAPPGGGKSLYIKLKRYNNEERYARYSTFAVNNEINKYILTVSGYTGTSADSLTQHSSFPFSTNDVDNDSSPSNCAVIYYGAWWYNACHSSNLNGYYYNQAAHTTYADGVNWNDWTGYHESLKEVYMMVR